MHEEELKTKGGENDSSEVNNNSEVNNDNFTYSFNEEAKSNTNNSEIKSKKNNKIQSWFSKLQLNSNRRNVVKKHCWDYYGLVRILITAIYFAIIIFSSSKIIYYSSMNYFLVFSIIILAYYVMNFGFIQYLLLSIYTHHYKSDENYRFIENINKLAKVLLTSDFMLHKCEIKEFINEELKICENNRAARINDIDLYFIKFRKTNNYCFRLSNFILIIIGITVAIACKDSLLVYINKFSFIFKDYFNYETLGIGLKILAYIVMGLYYFIMFFPFILVLFFNSDARPFSNKEYLDYCSTSQVDKAYELIMQAIKIV